MSRAHGNDGAMGTWTLSIPIGPKSIKPSPGKTKAFVCARAGSSCPMAVAESPLVKTAIHGADPNWGRIVSAAGYAGVPFHEEELSLWIDGVAPSIETTLTPPALVYAMPT